MGDFVAQVKNAGHLVFNLPKKNRRTKSQPPPHAISLQPNSGSRLWMSLVKNASMKTRHRTSNVASHNAAQFSPMVTDLKLREKFLFIPLCSHVNGKVPQQGLERVNFKGREKKIATTVKRI